MLLYLANMYNVHQFGVQQLGLELVQIGLCLIVQAYGRK